MVEALVSPACYRNPVTFGRWRTCPGRTRVEGFGDSDQQLADRFGVNAEGIRELIAEHPGTSRCGGEAEVFTPEVGYDLSRILSPEASAPSSSSPRAAGHPTRTTAMSAAPRDATGGRTIFIQSFGLVVEL
jgi:hypothetical protein